MNLYIKYKKLAVAYWEALNDNNLTKDEKIKDAKAFNEFFENFMNIVYFCFSIFSFFSIYFLITRVFF